MKTLYLIRHSLTEANERRLYGGSTDSPLSEKGIEIARQRRGAIPECDLYITSGMLRADQTLLYFAQKVPDRVLGGLREMDFGAFEMRTYEDLKAVPEYIQWIEDDTGEVRCPGGECLNIFRKRVLAAGRELLALEAEKVCAVCHGGVIVQLMQAWFPDIHRHFYQWQPGACRGYRIDVIKGAVTGFKEV